MYYFIIRVELTESQKSIISCLIRTYLEVRKGEKLVGTNMFGLDLCELTSIEKRLFVFMELISELTQRLKKSNVFRLFSKSLFEYVISKTMFRLENKIITKMDIEIGLFRIVLEDKIAKYDFSLFVVMIFFVELSKKHIELNTITIKHDTLDDLSTSRVIFLYSKFALDGFDNSSEL
jgi:hypothetical protein